MQKELWDLNFNLIEIQDLKVILSDNSNEINKIIL